MGSRTTTRIVALTALLGTAVALGFVITRSTTSGTTTELRVQLTPLTAPAEDLAAQIDRLRVGRSARPAQRAAKRLLDSVTQLATRVSDEPRDERAKNALEREAEYLDAFGSVLSNPRSPLAGELAERGARARAALAAAPGGEQAAAATRGWQRVLAHARARRESGAGG